MTLFAGADLPRHLPGEELVRAGLDDLEHRRETPAALLVSIGASRLRGIGIDVPYTITRPEERLFDLLESEDPRDAHSRYNALTRRLVSFERAAECLA